MFLAVLILATSCAQNISRATRTDMQKNPANYTTKFDSLFSKQLEMEYNANLKEQQRKKKKHERWEAFLLTMITVISVMWPKIVPSK